MLFVCFWAVCNLTLFAQVVSGPRIIHPREESVIHVPPQEAPAGLKKIYSNLGKSKTDLYLDNSAWVIAGPNSVSGAEFIGLPFTPKSDSHVSQARVAVEYDHRGTNQVNLSIYSDSSGSPGTLLAGPVTVTNLPKAGTCCVLTVADFTPLAVTGGTQYWVVVDTPLTGTGSDFYGSWDFVVQALPQAFSNGSNWYLQDVNEQVAGEVLGTIP